MSNGQELFEIRVANINLTQKSLQRILIILYLLIILLVVSWYNINFEGTDIDDKIGKLDQALTIEELKPWDEFLNRTASCFSAYFFEYGKGVVTKEKLTEYLKKLENENTRLKDLIDLGYQRPFPVNQARLLIQSEQHWQDCAFWAQRESLVYYMHRTKQYLDQYIFLAGVAHRKNNLEAFWKETDSLNYTIDSLLRIFRRQLDSLLIPFEGSIRLDLDPFSLQHYNNSSIWGRSQEFDKYSRFDLQTLLHSLQLLNHVSDFKKLIVANREVLRRATPDLQRLMFPASKGTLTVAELNDTYGLSALLNSRLPIAPDLPDSIQLPKVRRYSLIYTEFPMPVLDTLIKSYYSEYWQATKDYTVEEVRGIKSIKNLLTSVRGNAKQKVITLGVEIVSTSIFYFIPIFSLCLYILATLWLFHLRTLLTDNPLLFPINLQNEVLKSPMFIGASSAILSAALALLPGSLTILVLFDQFVTKDTRGIALNPFLLWVIVFTTLTVLIWFGYNLYQLRKLRT